MPQRVGLIASLPEELRPVKRRLRLRLVVGHAAQARGQVHGSSVTAILAGVGAQAAASAARALVAEGCDLLISLGFAGGLDPALAAGEARAVARVLGPDGDARLPSQPCRLPSAVLISVAQAAGTVAEKAELRDRTGADLVDMETWAVAAVAAELGVPWLGLRAVSDSARDTLPDLVRRHVRPDLGRVQTLRIVLAALVSPRSWAPLIGLGVRSVRAGNALAEAVALLLEDLA